MKFNDAVLGIFFILLGVLLFYLSRNFPPMPGQAYGPDLFPRLIGAAMAIGGALLLTRGLVQRRAGVPWVEPLEWMRSPNAAINFALVVAVLVFYILSVDRLGFPITGFLCLMVLILRLRGVSSWPHAIVVSFTTVLLIQIFFGKFLRVPLPWGVLQVYAW